MLLLFAVGGMNALWRAAVAGFLLLAKRLSSRAAGAALIAGAAWMVE